MRYSTTLTLATQRRGSYASSSKQRSARSTISRTSDYRGLFKNSAKRVFHFLPEIQSVVLFGSTARAQLTKTSDVDLLVLVPNLQQEPFNELMKSIDKLASDIRGLYSYPLSAVTMTIKDFEAAFREKKRIAQDVVREGIVLFGEERYYILLGRLIA